MGVLKMFNYYSVGIMVLSLWMGIKNFIVYKRFGIEGRRLNNI